MLGERRKREDMVTTFNILCRIDKVGIDQPFKGKQKSYHERPREDISQEMNKERCEETV